MRCKLAMSLDGRTALASVKVSGSTGAAARLDVHRLEPAVQPIMTGVATVLADDRRFERPVPKAWIANRSG
ncbi:MAG: dihydrofolate reductase family protein [Candidatus Competibacteraceae bacterium]